ncbi:chloride channel protein [Candidatus Fermentibacteria bacterium]|nr:chloride channel protein [Candidatus Fermentibacteria bacterium]
MRRFRAVPASTRPLLVIVVCATAAGLSAVAFMLATHAIFAATMERFAEGSLVGFAWKSLLTITVSSLAVGLLLYRISPQAAGSGIPQLKVAFWKDLGFLPFRISLVKFVAGALSIGGGSSLGREGPSAFIAGGVASALGGRLGVFKASRRGVTSAGSAAGLAAAFNTPMASIGFLVEEIIGDLNTRYLGGAALAAVMGAFAVHAVIGPQPSFLLPVVQANTWTMYMVVPVVASLAALLGIAFQRATLRWRMVFRGQTKVPAWALPVFGGWITWILGIAAFHATGRVGVFGLGYHDLSDALTGAVPWSAAVLLVLCKLVATVACYSAGGCGGIFAPTLFLGGLTGAAVAGFASLSLPLAEADQIILAAVGMSACFGAVVQAPLTALLIVFEMTHQFQLVPALIMATVISQAIARRGGGHNFYDALLEQDGHELMKIKPPRDLGSWRNLPVSVVANRRPVAIPGLDREGLRRLLVTTPYQSYPVEHDGKPIGIVTRKAIQQAVTTGSEPPVDPVVTVFPAQTIHEASQQFIRSTQGLIVVVDPDSGRMTGILTLHDLLRAQAAVQE